MTVCIDTPHPAAWQRRGSTSSRAILDKDAPRNGAANRAWAFLPPHIIDPGHAALHSLPIRAVDGGSESVVAAVEIVRAPVEFIEGRKHSLAIERHADDAVVARFMVLLP